MGDGTSNETGVPVHWSKEQNVRWKVNLPGPGNSSPIVSGSRVFITCAQDQGKKRGLYCFDRKDGSELWSRVVDFERVMPTHETNPYCAPTPATDGKRIVVWHGSAGLFCYDLDGKELWRRDLGEFHHQWGYAASPVIYRDRVIQNCAPGDKAFVAAFDLADGREVAARLPVVHRALYLLFNEGYHGASPASAVRGELVQEAMRLVSLLLDHPAGRTPSTGALAALMCLHAARMPARLDEAGDLTPFFEQDRARWDASLIAQGRRLLDESAAGAEVTPYHIEAAIAGVHAGAPSAAETDWGAIVRLYDALLALRPSPVVALHRAIAVAQQQGPARGLEAIAGIEGRERLEQYPFYAAALGEMELGCGRAGRARECFRQALALARNPTERRSLEKRLAACDDGPPG